MSDQQFQKMQDIGGLFFRRLNGELSEADQITLDKWMDQQDAVSRQFFEEITEWEEVQAALHKLYQFDEAAAWEDIQKKSMLKKSSLFRLLRTSNACTAIWRRLA